MVYTFQDLQTQANLCTWIGALQKQGLRLIDIMDVRTLTHFIRKSMWCWADDHPRKSRGGYEQLQASNFPPTTEHMGTQPSWRVKFLQRRLLAWSYYSNAHRDRRIDPTFMPMTRRWSWTTFGDLQKQNPNIVYNFPKFNFAPIATSTGLAQQLRDWNQVHQEVPDLAFVAASHFNRLIILLFGHDAKGIPNFGRAGAGVAARDHIQP